MSDPVHKTAPKLGPLASLIFASRWLQLPLYLGLIAAQAVYVVHFVVELEPLLAARRRWRRWSPALATRPPRPSRC
jgi:hypothetical protein